MLPISGTVKTLNLLRKKESHVEIVWFIVGTVTSSRTKTEIQASFPTFSSYYNVRGEGSTNSANTEKALYLWRRLSHRRQYLHEKFSKRSPKTTSSNTFTLYKEKLHYIRKITLYKGKVEGGASTGAPAAFLMGSPSKSLIRNVTQCKWL